MRVQRKLNESTTIDVVIDEANETAAFAAASSLTSMPDKCSCGSTDLKLDVFRSQQGHRYVKLCCNTCGSKAELSSFRDGQGTFWKAFNKRPGSQKSLTPEPAKKFRSPATSNQAAGLNLGF